MNKTARRRVLMVAFHFPPEGGSGTQRTLKFARYLPEFGWDVEVLTVETSAHYLFDQSLAVEIPPQVAVHRTRCPQPPFRLRPYTLPDRYIGWWPFAVLRGMSLLRRGQFDVLYTTSPVRTAHLIGRTLARQTGVPWVCDFRDQFVGADPASQQHRQWLTRLEGSILGTASAVVANTPHLEAAMLRDHPACAGRVTMLPNGYDESDFECAPALRREPASRVVILHTGEIYPAWRDPKPLFEAAARLVARGEIGAGEILFRFVGSGKTWEESDIHDWLAARGLSETVRLEPHMKHGACVAELLSADALLLLQCSPEIAGMIPAKAFEYLRSGRPVLTLAPPGSATAKIMEGEQGGWVIDAARPDELDNALREIVRRHRSGELAASWPKGTRYERRQLAGSLAGVLESVARSPLGN